MKFKLLVSSFTILSFAAAFAQTPKDSSGYFIDSSKAIVKSVLHEDIKPGSELTWYKMITNVPHDISTYPAAAFSADKIPLFAALTAGTGALMLFDEPGWHANRRLFDNSPVFHSLSNFGVSLGEAQYHFALAGAFAVLGLVDHNQRALKTASNIVEVVIASGISVQLLKRVFGRESPAAATEYAGNWKFFPNLIEYQKHQPKYYAYPSGHITTLTATVTVIANNFPEEKWIKPVGYSLIVLTGIGLVSRGMHWYSDLPMGFFLGYTFGNIIAPLQNNSHEQGTEADKLKLNLSPLLGFNNIGMRLSFNF